LIAEITTRTTCALEGTPSSTHRNLVATWKITEKPICVTILIEANRVASVRVTVMTIAEEDQPE
jgi:hypothetical protein